MKNGKNGTFVRDGVAVELVLDRADEYEDVLAKASEVIDFPRNSSWTSSDTSY